MTNKHSSTYIFRSADVTAEKIGDFTFELEHLEKRLDNLNKLLDSNELKVKNIFIK